MATLLFRKPRADTDPVDTRRAIIDIGSNSIRLVVYDGPPRLPAVLFNEKVMAGLGKSLGETGAIEESSLALARGALARFAMLAREMGVHDLRTVATAAVRDASNGKDLIKAAKAVGLQVETLSGLEEAMASGMGVLSGIPDADGIVGDLGGGSLELVRVVAGAVTDRISFPLGVLRIQAIRAKGHGALDRKVAKMLRESGWLGRGEGLPFYLVGGSWRAVARLDMHLSKFPLPIVHQYVMEPERIARLGRTVSHVSKAKLKSVAGLSSGRIATLGDAQALLTSVLKHLKSTRSVVSAYGLREGLLFSTLSPEARREDPLIAAAREEGDRLGRFPGHGDLLNQWVEPLFDDETPDLRRLRHVSCLLADVGWRANPEFRAERGLDTALHGNWVAIDSTGRAVLAQALFTALGGGQQSPEPLPQLASPDLLRRAQLWGLAIRLGQRISGGAESALRRCSLKLGNARLAVKVAPEDAALYGDSVERRHKTLAEALGVEPELRQ
ncbi:Ppx/GppA family phosphatase [Stakelama tenebrarum]|uniref:Ppx/GppA family phosphatase n=1 Tax=Stakelama tenebrarum TaxID=2711215 RepID=A0A6G6Y6W0_9SPHN|nr:Ppx/GppA family phosphatase [Sphingosinithalassobacter tenebrarum]QIG80316.1 Ppx/GppA family phosphatase [Sphingosinithalassobacter tenebrarum]